MKNEDEQVIDEGVFGNSKNAHPKLPAGISILAFLERFTFYLAFSFLVYEMASERFPKGETDTLFTVYLSYVMITLLAQVPGGIIVDGFPNPLRALVWGGFFLATGFFVLPFGGPLYEYPGVTLVTIGSALFGPALLSWLAGHYKNRQELAPSGLSFFIGARMSGTLVGTIAMTYALEWIGWKEGLMISGIILLSGLLWYISQKVNIAGFRYHIVEKRIGKFNSLFTNSVLFGLSGSTVFLLARTAAKASQILQPEYGKGISNLVGQTTVILVIISLFVFAHLDSRSHKIGIRNVGMWSLLSAFASAFLMGSADYIDSAILSIVLSVSSLMLLAWSQAQILPVASAQLLLRSPLKPATTAGILNLLLLAPFGMVLTYWSKNLPWIEPLLNAGSVAILVGGGFYMIRAAKSTDLSRNDEL